MSLEASGGKSKMQWQNPAQQNAVYKLHMISKLWASSCWGFLQIIPFWLSHPSAGKVWVTSSQLVLRCNPCFRSTIIKSYLSFGKKLFSFLCCVEADCSCSCRLPAATAGETGGFTWHPSGLIPLGIGNSCLSLESPVLSVLSKWNSRALGGDLKRHPCIVATGEGIKQSLNGGH